MFICILLPSCHVYLGSTSFIIVLCMGAGAGGEARRGSWRGFCHPLPEKAITHNGFPLLSFSQIPVVTQFIQSTAFKFFHCGKIGKGGE